jgi:hypothetical protein
LHYAALVPISDGEVRRRRFQTALDLYAVRSKAVHDHVQDRPYKFGGEKLLLNDIASRARTMLRETIVRLLGETPPESKAKVSDFWISFWERQIFGLAE